MKFLILFVLITLCFSANAQDVNHNGVTYKIKGKTILQDGTDVTTTLSLEEQATIFEAFNKQKALEKERNASEKAIKKAENEQKSAEKKQKKAEKALKAKEKAKSDYDKASANYQKAVSKHEKLISKGKLSPADEAKSLKKIENLKQDLEKAKKKL